MGRVGEWLRRLWYLLNRARLERELEEEMAEHRMAMREPRRFGNAARLREEVRDVWGWTWFDNCRQDLIQGARQLRRSIGFTAVALFTLAVAIGVNTALYGAVVAALFTPLPVQRPAELRQVEWTLATVAPGFSRRGNTEIPYAAFEYLRQRAATLTDVFCISPSTPINARIDGHLQRSSVRLVSGNYFSALGVSSQLGRPIVASDDVPGAASVAVVSHSFWQRRFDAAPGAIGQGVELNGQIFTVIGVTPEWFYVDNSRRTPDLILPVSHDPRVATGAHGRQQCKVIGRLASDATEEGGRQEIEQLVRQAYLADLMPLPALGPPTSGSPERLKVGLATAATGIGDLEWRDVRDNMPAIAAVALIAGAVVLITCANIGGMLLARAMSRRTEIASRLAIGATPGRIIRQLLTESVLLAVLGGILGVAICYGLVKTSSAWGVPIALDYRVLLGTATLSTVMGVLVGLTPATTAARTDLLSVTKSMPGTKLDRFGFLKSGALVGVQVTTSFLLLAVVGLLILPLLWNNRSIQARPDRVLLFRSNPNTNGYSDSAVANYIDATMTGLAALPGVIAASVSKDNVEVTSLQRLDSEQIDNRVPVSVVAVGPNFFKTIGVPLIRGRDIQVSDRQGAAAIAVVNEAFARLQGPNSNPIGKQLTVGTIVGVVGESPYGVGLKVDGSHGVGATVYVSQAQRSPAVHLRVWDAAVFIVRTDDDAASFVPAVRRAMVELEPNVPIDRIHTQAELLDESLKLRGRVVLVFGLVAAVALMQAVFGIYGTLSLLVNRRRPEIAVRLALGAQRSSVIRFVLRQSLAAILAGILVGVGGTVILGRLMMTGGMLQPVSVTEQLSVVALVLIVIVLAALASSAPAWRISRTNPAQALKGE
jgi:predicted permease